ncbi:MAG: dUTP diphosphatase [Sandaracinaceae bacterium]
MRLRVERLREEARVPAYATDGAAGLDLAAALDAPLTLAPGAWAAVPTGLAIQLPPRTEGQVRPRSGLAARHGVTVLNAPGTIDEDYRGEVKVLLVNLGPEPFVIETGFRIAQLVVAPIARVECEVVDALGRDVTRRGDSGAPGSEP